MKIVITDGYALNPGDLNWNSIEQLGKLTVYDRTSANEIYERCKEAEIVLSNKTVLSKENIEKLSRLRMIGVLATGYNVIDVDAAKSKGVTVCNVPGYGIASVAQHAFSLLLTLSNHVDIHSQSVSKGEWVKSPDWSYSKKPMTELAGKTMGIVGLGNIGQQTARIAKAFGMKIIYYTPKEKQTDLGIYTELTTLFSESDVVSLHCPLTTHNREFVNAGLLQLMKPTAFLINTARGQLVNEQDLADALNNKKIAGAALDVLSVEPPNADNPLLKASNCIITPHNAWMTKEARQRIIDVTTDNIKSFLANKPKNIVLR